MAKGKNKGGSKKTFADLLAELKHSTPGNNRSTGQRVEKRYFLIVCEGEKTEPLYFKALSKELPKNVLDLHIEGTGFNTVSLVKRAGEIRKSRLKQKSNPPYDQVWTVFDRDDFPAAHVNEAIHFAATQEIGTAFSNEAFELWYCLHFHYLDTGISRGDYVQRLSDILSKKMRRRFVYQKNSAEFLSLLQVHGNRSQAIRYAQKLEALHSGKSPAEAKPSTSVYRLVNELEKLKPSE